LNSRGSALQPHRHRGREPGPQPRQVRLAGIRTGTRWTILVKLPVPAYLALGGGWTPEETRLTQR